MFVILHTGIRVQKGLLSFIIIHEVIRKRFLSLPLLQTSELADVNKYFGSQEYIENRKQMSITRDNSGFGDHRYGLERGIFRGTGRNLV